MSYCRNRTADTELGPCDIWGGSVSFRIPAQSSPIALRSTTDSDTLQVEVRGLRAWVEPESSEIVRVTGTTASMTRSDFVVINFIVCVDAVNVGTITATSMSGGLPMGYIIPKMGQSHDGIWAVPMRQELRLTSLSLGSVKANGSTAVHAHLMVNSLAGWRSLRGFSLGHYVLDSQIRIIGPAVCKVTAEYTTDRDIWAAMDGFLVDGN